MKKLLLLPVVGLVAASCSTTDYYQDDLAVAQRLDDESRQARAIEARSEGQAAERDQEVRQLEAKLDDLDKRIGDIEASMEDMPEPEREQTAAEISELRERQSRAEAQLRETDDSAPLEFSDARNSLRDAVNELEIGYYRLLVRDDAETRPGESIQ